MPEVVQMPTLIHV